MKTLRRNEDTGKRGKGTDGEAGRGQKKNSVKEIDETKLTTSIFVDRYMEAHFTNTLHFYLKDIFTFFFFFVFLPFLGLLPWHMGVPRLGV